MSRGVALIAESAEWADSEDLHRRIDELQILNKQHIKNEGINIIAYLHSKPQIYSRVAICQSIALAPIQPIQSIQQLVLPRHEYIAEKNTMHVNSFRVYLKYQPLFLS